ncbi:hypothetical protein ScPMuIL_008918 [Solemya velum]
MAEGERPNGRILYGSITMDPVVGWAEEKRPNGIWKIWGKQCNDAEDSPLFSKTDGASQKKKKRVTFAVQLENVRPLVFDIAATVSEEAVLARHGPYLLTATDFRSLLDKNWLTDN